MSCTMKRQLGKDCVEMRSLAAFPTENDIMETLLVNVTAFENECFE